MRSARVLMDTSARREGVTHGTGMVTKSLRWSEVDVTEDVAERKYLPPDDDEHFRIEQIPYLATVATLSRLGRVELFPVFRVIGGTVAKFRVGPWVFGLRPIRGH